ncbi:phosphotransferase [Shewanella sp. KT0246]|uniref:phosphotransferase n=1 Tax=Shewanella sp. KT0246 TaxID=2815912 RepID=UPI001BC465E6|nr:phosphotransferase [Shewanella sp. KT0246]GIU53109.1 aminoglycoside phosphotransferase [Shewanella sp. KT0246]
MTVFNPWALLPTELKHQLPSSLVVDISDNCNGVDRLSAGLSNSNYYLKMPSQDWVLRDNKDIEQWCDRDNEVACWRMAQAIKLAPKLIWQSETKQFYLSEFIKQTSFDWSSTFSEYGFSSSNRPSNNSFRYGDGLAEQYEPVSQLLSLLKQFTTLALPPKVISITEQWQVYLESLAELSNNQLDEQWCDAFEQLTNLKPAMTSWLTDLESCLIRPQFCHRDLSPFNLLLQQDNLLCIDFEYCAASHPMFDLASILATHQLTEQQAKDLSEQYLCQHPNLQSNAIHYLEQIYNCFWAFGAAWALMMAAKSTHSEDEQLINVTLVDESSTNLKTSYFLLFNKYLSLIS